MYDTDAVENRGFAPNRALFAALVASFTFVATAAADDAVAPASAMQPPPPPAARADAPRFSKRKLIAIATMGGGGVLLGTGIGFGLSARGRWNDAKDVCGGSTTCANDDDTRYAQALSDSARTRANVSTVLFVAGGLAAAAGIYLFVTAPDEHAVTVSATGSPTSAGLVIGGAF